jgi:SAM-dependent methyltransferase
MAAYVGEDLARFLLTVQLATSEPARRLLEIGSNPYFISRLLLRHSPEATLAMTNYFGGPEPTIEQAVVDAAGRELAFFRSELVDVETMALPYPDGAFDMALLCEVIEHFVRDPVFAVREIHRTLAPGGRLILTTPNVARAGNLVRLGQRQGIYDPYSRHGLHGRHNREYVAEELFDLLESNGFAVVRYLTRPVHGVRAPDAEWFRAADDDGAGDYHFVVARRGPSVPPTRPPWLYR